MGIATNVNQRKRMLEYMRKHGGITEAEARFQLGITQTGTRIWELKNKDGVMIKSVPMKGKNRDGRPVHFTRYELISEEELS